MELNILKKNRKYYKAENSSGYKCKVLIDSNSENLELGKQNLAVDDISVKSKYGTDLIYKLSASAEEQKDAGICSLRTPFYNQDLVGECRKLGGNWDKAEQCWIFPSFVENEVEVLDEKYNSESINIEITTLTSLNGYQSGVYLAGFKIAQAWGRDSGAKLADGVALMSGHFNSGGSMKNWKTVIHDASILRMSIPKLCLEDFESNDDIEIKVL